MRWLAVLLLSVPLALGCAGRAFEAARAEDSAAAYHRFLREHPNASQAEAARQHLELARVRNAPSAEGYRAFALRWPQSPLLPELRRIVGEPAFAQARAAATPAAYRAFLEEFAESPLAARARGNLAYLEARGFDGDPEALAEFARQHPESDHAAEAGRTAAGVAARSQTAFRRAGYRVAFSPATPGRDRLARVFAERAVASFSSAGVELVPLAAEGDPRAAELPAVITIHHREEPVSTVMRGGEMTSPGIEVETSVVLTLGAGGQEVWRRTTRFKAPAPSAVPDTSVVFAPGAERYWEGFSVPVLRWNTRAAVRSPHAFERPVLAARARGERVAVLFADGGFQLLDLADPEKPWTISEYKRPHDLKRFGGLRLLDAGVAVFGEDGLELVSLGAEGPALSRSLDRVAVGSLHTVEPWEGGLVAAGQRGLWWIGEDSEPELLLDHPVTGLARSGEHLVFADARGLYLSSPALLRQGRVAGELELGPGVRPGAIRVVGTRAVVLSQRGALHVDLAQPSAPRVLSWIEAERVGALRDGMELGGQLYLLGERGLQVLARDGRVIASADVAARTRLDAMGRHLLLSSDVAVQAVDRTPFRVPTSAALD